MSRSIAFGQTHSKKPSPNVEWTFIAQPMIFCVHSLSSISGILSILFILTFVLPVEVAILAGIRRANQGVFQGTERRARENPLADAPKPHRAALMASAPGAASGGGASGGRRSARFGAGRGNTKLVGRQVAREKRINAR
jgi:hypothetical protein